MRKDGFTGKEYSELEDATRIVRGSVSGCSEEQYAKIIGRVWSTAEAGGQEGTWHAAAYALGHRCHCFNCERGDC